MSISSLLLSLPLLFASAAARELPAQPEPVAANFAQSAQADDDLTCESAQQQIDKLDYEIAQLELERQMILLRLAELHFLLNNFDPDGGWTVEQLQQEIVFQETLLANVEAEIAKRQFKKFLLQLWMAFNCGGEPAPVSLS